MVPNDSHHCSPISQLLPQTYGLDYNIVVLEQPSAKERVALVIFRDSSDAQVWFRDVTLTWHYVSPSFKAYVRLLIQHLGIERWQYAYTQQGVDTETELWLRLLAPDRARITIDKHQTNTAPTNQQRPVLKEEEHLRNLDEQKDRKKQIKTKPERLMSRNASLKPIRSRASRRPSSAIGRRMK